MIDGARRASGREIGVGIIGAGLRGALVLGARIVEMQRETGLRLRAICDRNTRRMREVNLYLKYAGIRHGRIPTFRRSTDYGELSDDPRVELVLVTTPTHLHAEPAVRAVRAGKRVFLDKPIATSLGDAGLIAATVESTSNPLLMGFTRRFEASWQRARELVAEGRVGRLVMMQLRSVIPYTRYYHTWHRRNEWSGGALNDKSSHHFDVFNWFAGSRWRSISAMGGQSPAFAPEPDPPAGCFTCRRDCPYNILKDPDFQEMGIRFIPPSWKNAEREQDRVDTCVFKAGADLTDHCVVNVGYENGVTASLVLCIFGPRSPDEETLELVGSEGRILLTRGTGTIEIWSDHGRRYEKIDCRTADFGSSHFGADRELVRRMRAFCDGGRPDVGVEAGLESLRMVHAAQRSIDAGGGLVRRPAVLSASL